MKPDNLRTKIFLDSGDPEETKQALDFLGFLDGQTTNPSLIAKSPGAQTRLQQGNKFTSQEVMSFYQDTVKKIAELIPQGSVSIEVAANMETSVQELFDQGKEMAGWIDNAHIKYPIIKNGLQAAAMSVREGLKVNMTLCFTQEQAAAVYSATKGAKKGDVFVSPFVGRLDDKQENGINLIQNIIKMYQPGDGHVEVLMASIRNMDHLFAALSMGVDIITAPFTILRDWAEQDLYVPEGDFSYAKASLLKPIGIKTKWI